MKTESPFYYPIGLHRGPLDLERRAPWVSHLITNQLFEDVVLLSMSLGNAPQGLQVLAEGVWRYVIPMEAISEAIIFSSAIDVYTDLEDPVVVDVNALVYRNGRLTNSNMLEPGPRLIYGVITPSSVAPQPPPGPDFFSYTTSTNVSGNRVIRVAIGGVTHASSDQWPYANLVLGVSMEAALAGTKVRVQTTGEMNEPSWSFIPGQPVFCGLDGHITQVSPSEGFSIVIGQASTPQTIIIAVKQPIVIG